MSSRRSAFSSKLFATTLLAAIASATLAHAEFTSMTVNKCLAGKIAATGKSLSSRALCYSKEARSGAADAACHQKAADKFTGGADPSRGRFEKLEDKFPSTDSAPCLSFDDQGLFDSAIAGFASTIRTTAGSAPGKCDAAKIKCTGKYVAAATKCFASAAKDSGAVEAACSTEAATKLTACLDKAAAPADCTNAGSQAPAIAADANDFLRVILCALDGTNPGCTCVPANHCYCVVQPSAPANGAYADCTGASPDDACDLTCDAGYTQAGADPICLDAGAATADWAGSPTCSPNPCASGPAPPVGGSFPTCAAGNVSHGATCDLSCDDGYSKTGSTDPTCTLGTYTNAGLTTCTAASCPAVTDPPGTSSDCTTKPTGSSCTINCDTGYTRAGSGAGSCVGTAPGTSAWQLDGSCSPNPCPAGPTPPTGGDFPTCASGNVPHGTTCDLSCNSGYSKIGSIDPECTLGTYATSDTACIAATCAAFSAPGTTSDCSALPTGSTCSFSCDSGYTRSGDATGSCVGTGPGTSAWQLDGSCNANPCAPWFIPTTGGTWTNCSASSVPSGTTCSLDCANGYTKTGSGGATCYLGAYTWDELATCTAATCAAFSAPGTTSNCSAQPTGSTCSFSCTGGYHRIGTSSGTCVGTGVGTSEWQLGGSCVENSCPTAPAPVANGSFPTCAAGNVPSGTDCALTCANGYTAAGGPAHCFLGAYTTSVVPTCVPATCPAMTTPTGVSGACGASSTGTTCPLTCSAGYNGSPVTATCTGTGVGTSEWVGMASCSPNSCVAPPSAPTGGTFPDCAAGNVPSGTYCELTCAAGYTKTGTNGSTCYLGAYAGLDESCVPATCSAFSATGTTSNCSAQPTGSTCSFSCNVGYHRVGTSTGTCVGTGVGTSEWQFGGSCVPDSCPGAPAPVAHGSFGACDAGNVPSGTDCPLTCENGYTAVGGSAHCFIGAYTSSSLSCVPATCAAMTTPTGVSGACGASPTGTTCPLTCSAGYNGTPVTATCTGTGVGTSEWVGTASCAPNSCIVPPSAPVGGSFPDCAAGNVPSGTSCELTCANGYTKTGTNGSTCYLGAYAGLDENCVPATCAALSVPGVVSNCVSSPTGSTCSTSCDSGYSGSPRTATCTGTGPGTSEWSNVATCDPDP